MCLHKVHKKEKFKTARIKCWKLVRIVGEFTSKIDLVGLYRPGFFFIRDINISKTPADKIVAHDATEYEAGFHCYKYKKNVLTKLKNCCRGDVLLVPVYVDTKDIIATGTENDIEVVVCQKLKIKTEDYDKAIEDKIKANKGYTKCA